MVLDVVLHALNRVLPLPTAHALTSDTESITK